MQKQAPKIFLISGPSGVGKDSIVEEIRKIYTDFHFVITAVTRTKRNDEIDGKNHFFVTEDKFNEMIENDELIEWSKVYKNYYGVPKNQVYEGIRNGKNVLIKIDVQGAKTIKKNEDNAIFIFLAPPNLRELEKRLKDRMTETPEALIKRIQTAEHEMKESHWFDYIIINHTDKLNETIHQIDEIIQGVTTQADFKS